MKHLLKLMDLTKEDITSILDIADQLKYELKHGIPHKLLDGKSVALILEKVSTRTRVAFETGINQLGGQPLLLSKSDLQMDRGEPIQDTARALSRYLDGVMIRTFDQSVVDNFAKYGTIPVMNGLTDQTHPFQTLADLMTIRERFYVLDDVKICYIGDGSNVANSLIVGALKMGMKISVATPKGYEPNENILRFAQSYGDYFELTDNPEQAIKDADVVATDTWISMGQENEKEVRIHDFKGYQINDALLKHAKVNVMVQHALPATRGLEITEEVFEAHADEIFEEAENRLHVQKAVVVKLLCKDKEN